MARFPGFIMKERRNSSTELPTSSECTGTDFRPAPTRIFTFRAHWYRLLYYKQQSTSQLQRMRPLTSSSPRSWSRDSPTRKVGSAFFRTHAYCDTSPCLADPALLSVVGFCGGSEYCKVVKYHTKNATTDVIFASWSCDTPTYNTFLK